MKDCLQEMRSFCKVIVDVVDKRYISSTSDVTNTLSCFHIPDICLGPLIFIIYLSGFERCLDYSRASMYADNTEITISSNNQVELIETAQAELLNISEWMRINKLSLNPTKTEYMIIDHPRRRKIGESLPQLFINGEKIKRVDKTKYLGVIVDDILGWEEQYESVKKKVAGGLAAMKKLKDILPQSMLFQVYKALAESHLRYADIVWRSL